MTLIFICLISQLMKKPQKRYLYQERDKILMFILSIKHFLSDVCLLIYLPKNLVNEYKRQGRAPRAFLAKIVIN